jgi:DNA-binding MurR/RpiR family transcriptional regulator
MTYETRIRNERSNMSKSFSKLADFLLDSYVESAFMTASELAQTLDLDAATVVRFSQHLGYSGYPQLQDNIRTKVKADLLVRPAEASIPDSGTAVAMEAMDEVILTMRRTTKSLDTDSLVRLVDGIGKARRIVVLPDGPAQPTAYSLVLYLEQGGFPIFIARTGIADLARTVNTTTSQDLMLAIEVAGHAPYIARALSEARNKGIPTSAIVGTASLRSARFADIVLTAQAYGEQGVGIVSLEAIVYSLSKVLRWRYSDRFEGSENAIREFSERIQKPLY